MIHRPRLVARSVGSEWRTRRPRRVTPILKRSIMNPFKSKKAVVAGFAAGAALGLTGAAVAYFTTDGAGSGAADVGTSTSLVINQDSITYSNASTDNALLPGVSATVTFTIDNPSSGNQHLGTISV